MGLMVRQGADRRGRSFFEARGLPLALRNETDEIIWFARGTKPDRRCANNGNGVLSSAFTINLVVSPTVIRRPSPSGGGRRGACGFSPLCCAGA